MSIEKSELKRLVVQNVAKKIETFKDKSSDDAQQCAGGLQALKDAIKGVESVRAKWKRALKDEEIPPATHAVVVEATEEVLGCIRNLLLKYEITKQQATGEVRMAEKTMDYCERIFVEEAAKVEAIESGEEIDGRGISRPTGTRPGLSLAAQRKAEEAPAKQKRAKKVTKKKNG